MSQLVVTRALKNLPPFNIFSHEGGVKKIKIHAMPVQTGMVSNLVMSPYSEMIPAIYLSQQYLSTFVNLAHLNNVMKQGGRKAVDVRKSINDYIFYSQPAPIKTGYRRRANIDRIIESFTIGSFYPESFRSGHGRYTVDQYSAFVDDGEYTELSPSMLLVIPRENYVYCKMELIKTGFLDLSKCVMLIDQQLDTTSYPNKNFRAVYRKLLLPEIAKLGVTIAKVPASYIKDKCFVPKFQFTSENIFERKKEEEEVKKELLLTVNKYLGVEGGSPPSSQVLTADNGITHITGGSVQLGGTAMATSANPFGDWIIGTDAVDTIHPTYVLTSNPVTGDGYSYIMNAEGEAQQSDRVMAMGHAIAAQQSLLRNELGISQERLGQVEVARYTGMPEEDEELEIEDDEFEIESEQGDLE